MERVAVGVFTVLVGLVRVDSGDQLEAEIGGRLDDFQLQIGVHPDGFTVLELAVPARDLWLALLHAMGAVTQIGLVPHCVQAKPAPILDPRSADPTY